MIPTLVFASAFTALCVIALIWAVASYLSQPASDPYTERDIERHAKALVVELERYLASQAA